ncbi:hypothetical protein Ddye_016209 [Dipteronia dyeriana]|uniref:Uncharacterized protein n=1 Tax=Dipteronia dyeriana TaxID=168575 RepID=A0AAD9X093_9ROSI|nr:hypothetical protein Ddye_016209 [Dipteronia dyeriana]
MLTKSPGVHNYVVVKFKITNRLRESLKTPEEEWYEGKVTRHDHFDAHGQIDDAINRVLTEWAEEDRHRLRASCFGHLLTMQQPVKFSGGIVHQLLLRDVHHNGPSDEMWFMIGTHEVRFSKVEFGLITGLWFDVLPDTSRYVSFDNGLYHRYFGGKDEISSLELRDVLRRGDPLAWDPVRDSGGYRYVSLNSEVGDRLERRIQAFEGLVLALRDDLRSSDEEQNKQHHQLKDLVQALWGSTS